MTQGFYSLDEAANVLGMAPDELNRMAQRREVRAFADRGTWRFRTQDIDEMAQQQRGGTGTEPSGGTGATGMGPSGSGTGATGMGPSGSGTGNTGIGDSGGMEDISFEDISLDDL